LFILAESLKTSPRIYPEPSPIIIRRSSTRKSPFPAFAQMTRPVSLTEASENDDFSQQSQKPSTPMLPLKLFAVTLKHRLMLKA